MTIYQILVGLLALAFILFWIWSLCVIAKRADDRAGYDEGNDE